MKIVSVEEFYKQLQDAGKGEAGMPVPEGYQHQGHFNVFDLAEVTGKQTAMPYDRRAYYKISFIQGANRAEYADKVVQIEKQALLFATPKVPYHWLPQNEKQQGAFCI